MAIRASFLLSISYFLGGIVTSPLELTFMRMFQGFASGLWPMELAIMTTYAPPKKLGICLGVMQGALTAGGIIGPLFGGILAEAFGMRRSFFLAAAALFLNFLVLVFFIKEPPTDTAPAADTAKADDKSGKVSLWKIPVIRLMLLSAALVQAVILIVQPILTTYISHLAGDIDNLVFVAGLIFSLGGFASAITAPLWGPLRSASRLRQDLAHRPDFGRYFLPHPVAARYAVYLRRQSICRRPVLLRHLSVDQRHLGRKDECQHQRPRLRFPVLRSADWFHGRPDLRRRHRHLHRHEIRLFGSRRHSLVPEFCHQLEGPSPSRRKNYRLKALSPGSPIVGVIGQEFR